jgi:hypothetical protein
VNKPNLFIIGATKCGTTSLHAWLDAHPEIRMSRIKEPGYFLAPKLHHPEIRHAVPGGDRLDGYLSLFAPSEGQIRYLGESSTGYTHFPLRSGVPERLRAFNSQARLIYVLRDPVQRTISHYWWNVRYEGERRDMLAAITEDRRYRDVSNYAMQLKEWLRSFDRSSIYVMTIEDLSCSPAVEMAALLRWLGVDDQWAGHCVGDAENRTPGSFERPRVQWLHQWRHSSLWERMGPRMPRWLRTLGRRIAEERVLAETRPDEVAAVEDYLRPMQREQVAELSSLLNRSFPAWRQLAGVSQSQPSSVGGAVSAYQ